MTVATIVRRGRIANPREMFPYTQELVCSRCSCHFRLEPGDEWSRHEDEQERANYIQCRCPEERCLASVTAHFPGPWSDIADPAWLGEDVPANPTPLPVFVLPRAADEPDDRATILATLLDVVDKNILGYVQAAHRQDDESAPMRDYLWARLALNDLRRTPVVAVVGRAMALLAAVRAIGGVAALRETDATGLATVQSGLDALRRAAYPDEPPEARLAQPRLTARQIEERLVALAALEDALTRLDVAPLADNLDAWRQLRVANDDLLRVLRERHPALATQTEAD